MAALQRLFIGTALVLTSASARAADSDLLNGVKRNPQEGQAMCQTFRSLNGQGKSAYDRSTTKKVAKSRQISRRDAEVLITYVVGIHCPDVR